MTIYAKTDGEVSGVFRVDHFDESAESPGEDFIEVVTGWPLPPRTNSWEVPLVQDGNVFWGDTRELATAKATKNAEINQKRLEANRSSFVFAGKEIACDELSMLDIQSLNGMITLIGDLPPSFQKQWKAIDNTYVAIPDKNTWIAFMGAMVNAGTNNFNRAQTLKAALAEATTNAEVDAIEWSTT